MLADIFGVDGIIVLIVVVVLLFGSTQLPKLARSLGSAQNEFKKGLAEGKDAEEIRAPEAKAADTPPTEAGPKAPDTPATGS